MLKHSVSNKKFECGTDEAGRGCLAGPVAAAAVILPKSFKNKILKYCQKYYGDIGRAFAYPDPGPKQFRVAEN